MKSISTLVLLMFFSIACSQSKQTKTMQNSDYKIFVLNELSREGNTDILVNPDPEVLKKYAPTGTFPMAINAFLVQKDNENILFDTGLGQKLVENLAAHNISPEQISKIFITHGHGDHIGGLLKDGKPIFPNAKLYINRVEYDYWMKEKNEPFTQVAETYKNNIQLFDIEKDTFDLMPDIQAIAAYGHTPGHTMYLIGKEKNQTLVWGDLTHAMLVQMPHPEISMTYDVNPEQAAKTRESVLKLVAEKEFKIAGMHVPLPGMGIIIKSKTEGYEFSPAR